MTALAREPPVESGFRFESSETAIAQVSTTITMQFATKKTHAYITRRTGDLCNRLVAKEVVYITLRIPH